MKKIIRFVSVLAILAGLYFFTPAGEVINGIVSPTSDSTAVDSSTVVLQPDTALVVLAPDTTKKDTVK